jgi:hexokinase
MIPLISVSMERECCDSGASPAELITVFRSVFEFLPFFEERMRAALRLILGDSGEKRIKMGLARDGSGVGGE